MTDKPSVIEAWTRVMEDVQAVRKGERNTAQGFNFRGIDAVMNAVGPALRTHGVAIIPVATRTNYREVEVGKNRTIQRECTVTVQYRIHGPAGDTMEGESCAEALDSGDKATSKAMSVAYRTFLLQSLTIPTDEPDPDHYTVERSARETPAPPGPTLISTDNVERMRQACAAEGVDIADVVASATDGRTEDPAQLLTSEIPAARDALRRLAAGPMADGGASAPATEPGSVVSGMQADLEGVPAGSASSRNGGEQ